MSAECDNFKKEDILEPGEHDVMFGRGGGTNNHVGNIKFRQLCFEHKFRYLAASKVDKPKVAREVVAIWRQQTPPGRFLTKAARDKSKGQESTWYDVGDQKAREKASQCLRERTPDVMPFIQQMKKQAPGPTPPNPIPDYTASNDSKQNTDDIPMGHFDAASIAVALLNKQVDGTENPLYFSSSIVHDIIELSRFLNKLSDCDHKFSSIAMATIFTVMEAVEESRLLSQYQAKLPKNIREIAKIDARNTVVTTPGTETSSLDRLSELSTNIDRNHLEDATINHNMVMMGPGFNYNSLDQTLSWMNMTMNLNEGNESDLINSIGCEIKSYPGELSPRLQWGDSILEEIQHNVSKFC